VNPVPDPLLLRKSGSLGNLTRTSGSVARNSDHYTTEAVICYTEGFENNNFSFVFIFFANYCSFETLCKYARTFVCVGAVEAAAAQMHCAGRPVGDACSNATRFESQSGLPVS
jgi:hypothetical protein